MKKRIGIFGGSFDPPHLGHFICARMAAEELQLDRVLVIPTHNQPQKANGHIAPPEVRWEMACAICAEDSLFQPSRVELDRGCDSYTIDTLRTLRELYPKSSNDLFLIVGIDAAIDFESWHEAEQILNLATLVIIGRAGFSRSKLSARWDTDVEIIDTPEIEISSTWVRDRVSANLPVDWLVGKNVAAIISKHELYSHQSYNVTENPLS